MNTTPAVTAATADLTGLDRRARDRALTAKFMRAVASDTLQDADRAPAGLRRRVRLSSGVLQLCLDLAMDTRDSSDVARTKLAKELLTIALEQVCASAEWPRRRNVPIAPASDPIATALAEAWHSRVMAWRTLD